MIVATVLLTILSYGLYHFGLRKAESRQQVNRLLPAFLVFGLLLLLTGLFALSDRISTLAPVDLPPIRSLESWRDHQPEGDKALFVGRAGNTGVDSPTYQIILADGILELANDHTFIIAPIDHPAPGGEIVVVALIDREIGDLEMDILYAGTRGDFIAYLWTAAIIPTATLVVSFALGVIVLALPFVYRRRFGTPSAPTPHSNPANL